MEGKCRDIAGIFLEAFLDCLNVFCVIIWATEIITIVCACAYFGEFVTKSRVGGLGQQPRRNGGKNGKCTYLGRLAVN